METELQREAQAGLKLWILLLLPACLDKGEFWAVLAIAVRCIHQGRKYFLSSRLSEEVLRHQTITEATATRTLRTKLDGNYQLNEYREHFTKTSKISFPKEKFLLFLGLFLHGGTVRKWN